LFTLLDVRKILLISGDVFEMRFKAESELEEPGPLRLHGGHVGLDALGGWMMLENQRLSTVLHGLRTVVQLWVGKSE